MERKRKRKWKWKLERLRMEFHYEQINREGIDNGFFMWFTFCCFVSLISRTHTHAHIHDRVLLMLIVGISRIILMGE